MKTVSLCSPIYDVEEFEVGDQIYISGLIATLRDQAQRLFIEKKIKGERTPSIEGIPVFHCGPVAYRRRGEWVIAALGPTTSARMEDTLPLFLQLSGVKIVIGKGGLSSKVVDEMRKLKAIYCAYPGGASALAVKSLRRVADVHWLNLGIPEALWILEVQRFGPLMVAVDCHGGNLYLLVEERVRTRLKKMGGR